MLYLERPPPPALAPFVRCLWLYESAAADAVAPSSQRIVPDGHPELILHHGDRIAELGPDGRARLQPRLILAGQISRPLQLLTPARSGVIGVRFHAGGARALVGAPMSNATDLRLDLAAEWGRDADDLIDAVQNAHNAEHRLALVAQSLAERLQRSAWQPDPLVTRGVGAMRQATPGLTIEQLAQAGGVSPRQLERRFLREVGVSPRLLASILRFRRLFDVLEHSPGGWAGAAVAAGYFDQAHMIRDFKRFAGQPPQAFCRSAAGLAAVMAGLPAAA